MKVYIVEAKRSAVGRFLGALKDVKPGDLAGQVIKDLTKNIDKNIVDEVIVGNILSAGHSQGIGRQASIFGGMPESTVAYSLNMLCGSGMKAVMNAVAEIKSREKDVIIAGGVESMSGAPFLVSPRARPGLGLGDGKLVDSISDALTDAFKNDGTVTAGNASGINDGASFTLIASEDAIEKYDLTPLVEIVDISQVGIDPSVMGLSPAYAIEKLLNKTNMKISDIDLIEINEAFAAQILGVFELLKEKVNLTDEIIDNKINVNGSGIALGHPVGASANRIIVSLVHEMLKQNSTYGLASLCIGGGLGTAVLLKSIK